MLTNQVITKAQAKAITGGRTPLLPVEYETAVQSLEACIHLDDAKYWSTKADALAAWAKMFHSRDALVKAKRLKLHAFRKMGELAQELRPDKAITGGRAHKILKEAGLQNVSATAALKLSKLSDKQFAIILKNPQAPTTVSIHVLDENPVYREFTRYAMNLRWFSRNNTTISVVQNTPTKRLETVRSLVEDLLEWLDDLEQRLPKVPK